MAEYAFICAVYKNPFKNPHRTRKGVPDDERCCSKSCSIRRTKPGHKWSNEQLLSALRERSEDGYAPPQIPSLRPSLSTYRYRFGSWTNACSAAGLLSRSGTKKPSAKQSRIDVPGRVKKPSLSRRFRVLQRDKFTCQYCGGTPQKGYVLNVDHVIPRSKGGSNEIENLITACELCNAGKGTVLLENMPCQSFLDTTN